MDRISALATDRLENINGYQQLNFAKGFIQEIKMMNFLQKWEIEKHSTNMAISISKINMNALFTGKQHKPIYKGLAGHKLILKVCMYINVE